MHLRAIAPILLATAATLPAEDAAVAGPIALGMGGSRIASVDDNTAAFVNPAMLGFMSRDLAEGQESFPYDNQNLADKDFGIGVMDLTATVRMHGKLADYIEQIDDIDVERLESLTPTTADPEDLKQLVAAASLIESYKVGSDFITADASVGLLNMRAWRIGLGVRMNAHLAAEVADIDLGNVGLSLDSGDIAQTINSVTPDGWSPSHQNSFITDPAAINSLTSAFNAANVTDNAVITEAISKLDYAAGEAGLTQEQVDALVAGGGLLTRLIQSSSTAQTAGNAGGLFTANRTSVTGVAMAYAEIPIAFGYAPADWISVGISPKLLIGKVGAVKVRIAGKEDDLSDYLEDALDDAEQTITGSIDAGVTVRWKMLQAALVGRNLTKPTFKAPTVETIGYQGASDESSLRYFTPDDVSLSPQATLGVAFIPWHRWVVEADMDLNPVELSLSGYEVQRANIGTRLDLWFFEPSVGISKNLAEDDIGEVVHGGVGLDLWAFRINVAGAMSLDTVEVDGSEVPREASFGVGIDSEW
ncbi:MAG: hypothetical protein RLZZ127_2751 [Planctomycetota bacterium]|jgi:hypothetical protein